MKEHKVCVFADFQFEGRMRVIGYDEDDRWLGDDNKNEVYVGTLSIQVDETLARKELIPKKVAGLEKEKEELGRAYREKVLNIESQISSLMAIENKSGE